MSSNGGYTDKKVSNDLMITRFGGNAYTSPQTAVMFSQFRAIEICKESGFKVARILTTTNQSKSRTVQRSSSNTTNSPTYVSGNASSNTNYNDYGNGMGQATRNTNLNGTVYGGNQNTQQTSWNETYRFPIFDTTFKCANQVYMTKIKVKNISVDDMRPLVKDLMGAVQLIEFMEASPNREVLAIGDIITKVDSVRIRDMSQFTAAIEGSKDKGNITLSIFRDGNLMTVHATATDATQVIESLNETTVNSACSEPDLRKRSICSEPLRLPAGE